MKPILLAAIATSILFLVTPTLRAQTPNATAPDAPELTKLLKEFLDGASRNDIAVHDRFWADELVYTSAKGRRKNKTDIKRELAAEEHPSPGEEKTVYTGEDIQIQQYGDTAVVAFRLVATSEKAGAKEIDNYLNTGTFLKRNGKWQAVAWQATAMPKSGEPAP